MRIEIVADVCGVVLESQDDFRDLVVSGGTFAPK